MIRKSGYWSDGRLLS